MHKSMSLKYEPSSEPLHISLKYVVDAGAPRQVCIKDIIETPSGQSKFKDIFIVTDLMDTDLHRIIRSSQDLSDDHVRYFAYQVPSRIPILNSRHLGTESERAREGVR